MTSRNKTPLQCLTGYSLVEVQPRLIQFTTQTYVIRTLGTCHQILPASLNTPLQEQLQVCTKWILTDVYFSYCWSLNHSYIYRQLMWQWLVLLITRRERKQTLYYRKAIFLLYWSSKAGFNCTTSYRPFMGLLYIKCYDHFQQTIYTRFLKFVLVYPYIKFNNFNVRSIILYLCLNQKMKIWNNS